MIWPGCPGQLAVLQRHGAVDDHLVDAERVALNLHAAHRQGRARLALDQNANLQSNFVALPCDETEHHAQWAGNPGNAGS
jgi:hypothetical protein